MEPPQKKVKESEDSHESAEASYLEDIDLLQNEIDSLNESVSFFV